VRGERRHLLFVPTGRFDLEVRQLLDAARLDAAGEAPSLAEVDVGALVTETVEGRHVRVGGGHGDLRLNLEASERGAQLVRGERRHLIWASLGRGLRPLRLMARDLAGRDADDMSAIDASPPVRADGPIRP
jgi:hypothetical protein